MLRSSLKRLSHSTFWKGGGVAPEDNDVVRYSGVSLRFLKQLKEDVRDGKLAADVELFVVENVVEVRSSKSECVVLEKGATIRVKRKLQDGTMKCRVQYKGAFDLPKDAPITPKPREKWTTEDICEYVVLEETRDEKQFYIELMQSSDVGKRFQGAFLSQARKSCFADLIDSLLNYYKGKDLSKQFVWFDVFCANQPLLTSQDKDLPEKVQRNREYLLKVGLHDAINQFDDRLIYFNSWLDPYPVQRAWCVWEIFGCVKSNKSLDILFQPGEEDVFMQTLLRDREEVTRRILRLRLEDAQCFIAKDKQGIDAAVAEQVGYHQLNVTISNLVRKWMKIFAQNVVDRKRREPGSARTIEFPKILVETGIFFHLQLGLQEEAEALFNECLEIRTKTFGPESPGVAAVLHELGGVMMSKGDYDKAMDAFEKTIRIYEKTFGGRDHFTVAAALHQLAGVYFNKGYHDKALEIYEEVLRIKEKTYGRRDHPNVAPTLNSIASVLWAKGDYDGALAQLEEVLQIYENSAGGKNQTGVATTLYQIASVLYMKGEYVEALKQFEEVLQIQEKAYGGRDHPAVAQSLNQIAMIYQVQGRYSEALVLYNESIRTFEKFCGSKEHPYVAATLFQLASLRQDEGEFEAALMQFEEVLRIQAIIYRGHPQPKIAATHVSIVNYLNRLGRHKESGSHLALASTILQSFPQTDILARLRMVVGVTRRLESKFEESRLELKSSLELRTEELHQPLSHADVQEVMFELAKTLQCLGEHEAATTILEDVLSARIELIANDSHIRVVEVKDLLAKTRK